MSFHHYVVVWTTDQTEDINNMLDDYATFEDEAFAAASSAPAAATRPPTPPSTVRACHVRSSTSSAGARPSGR